ALFVGVSQARSGRGEHRHWRAALARLEHEPDGLADTDRVEIAIDDVGHHGRALGERHIGDAVGHRRPAHHAVGVDGTAARRFLPFGLVAEAERAVGARIEMRLAARTAFLVEELALRGGVPEIRLPSETKRPPWPFSQKPRSSSCITTVIVKLS